MAYNIGALLFGADFSGRFAELLAAIEPASYTAGGDVDIQQATRREFDGIAAGVFKGRTLVLKQAWPYDCSFQPEQLGPLDETLAALSAEAPVLCLLIDETSMTFGLSLYEDGERVRVRQTDPDGVRSDWGTPLAAEAGLAPDQRDDSERIMRLTAHFLGRRLDALIAGNELELTRYDASGAG